MDETRATLLERVRNAGDHESWREFYEIYQPLLLRYARARGLNEELSEEVVQQCMATLTQAMREFVYSRERGRFKGWLRRLVNNRINDFLKKKKLPNADSLIFREASDSADNLDQIWERQWRKRHLKYCLDRVRGEIAPQTFQAFEYYVLAEWPVDRVCQTLGMSADQIYAAKSRVTKRLREKMVELIGEEL